MNAKKQKELGTLKDFLTYGLNKADSSDKKNFGSDCKYIANDNSFCSGTDFASKKEATEFWRLRRTDILNNKNKIGMTKRYRSNIEIFVEDKYGNSLFCKSYYSDNYAKRSDIPTIKEIKEELGVTLTIAKKVKSELESWMSGVRNDWK